MGAGMRHMATAFLVAAVLNGVVIAVKEDPPSPLDEVVPENDAVRRQSLIALSGEASSPSLPSALAAKIKLKAKLGVIKQKEKLEMHMLKLKKAAKLKEAGKAATAKKIKAMRVAQKARLLKLKQKLWMKQKLTLGKSEINTKLALNKSKQRALRSKYALEAGFKLKRVQEKIKAAQSAADWSQKRKAQQIKDQDFILSKTRELLRKKSGWKHEKADKHMIKIRTKTHLKKLRIQELTNKNSRKGRDPAKKRLRKLDREASGRVRGKLQHVGDLLRRSFHKQGQYLRKIKNVVVSHIKYAQRDATKVEEENATNLGIKFNPTVHFKVDTHVKDLDDHHLFKDVKT